MILLPGPSLWPLLPCNCLWIHNKNKPNSTIVQQSEGCQCTNPQHSVYLGQALLKLSLHYSCCVASPFLLYLQVTVDLSQALNVVITPNSCLLPSQNPVPLIASYTRDCSQVQNKNLFLIGYHGIFKASTYYYVCDFSWHTRITVYI